MNREKTNIEQLISPKHLPEAGFQSYEQFANDATAKREGFIADEYRNPSLHYERFLSPSAMDQEILLTRPSSRLSDTRIILIFSRRYARRSNFARLRWSL